MASCGLPMGPAAGVTDAEGRSHPSSECILGPASISHFVSRFGHAHLAHSHGGVDTFLLDSWTLEALCLLQRPSQGLLGGGGGPRDEKT